MINVLGKLKWDLLPHSTLGGMGRAVAIAILQKTCLPSLSSEGVILWLSDIVAAL